MCKFSLGRKENHVRLLMMTAYLLLSIIGMNIHSLFAFASLY